MRTYRNLLAILFVMLYMIILLFLTSCSGTITVTLTNPDGIAHDIKVETARRTMVAVDGGQVTVITGQVAIDDETVQALGRSAVRVVEVPYKLEE